MLDGSPIGFRFIQALSRGDAPSARALFASDLDIDDPWSGRVLGPSATSTLEEWNPRRFGEIEDVVLEHVVSSGVWELTEVRVHLRRWNGKRTDVGIAVVCERDSAGAIARARLYYRRQMFDGGHYHRAATLDTEVRAELPAILIEYQTALRERDLHRFLATFAVDGYVDFHGESKERVSGLGLQRYDGTEEISYAFEKVFAITPTNPRVLSHRNWFTAGQTHVVEFFLARRDESDGHAGIAAYEVRDGEVYAARVYDEAWG